MIRTVLIGVSQTIRNTPLYSDDPAGLGDDAGWAAG
jgi:hypothetical protein